MANPAGVLKARRRPYRTLPGVTLLELLTVLTMISLLAALALPAWQAQTDKARLAEARALLLECGRFLERWRAQYGRYTDTSTRWPRLPVAATSHFDIVFGAGAANTDAGKFLLRAVPKRGSGTTVLELDQDGNLKQCEREGDRLLRCRLA